MHGLLGNGAREKTALMPDPLWRSSFDFTTLDSRREYGHGAPKEGPVGTLPQTLRPWEAWGSLMDLCGRFRPVGPPRSSCDAYVGRVCHCHGGGDRRSRHPVRLVWVNGSFGCRPIAAWTRDLKLDTILAVTNSYSTVLVLLWDCTGQPNPQIDLKWGCDPPPLQGMVLGTRCHALVLSSPPPMLALRRGVKRYPEPMAHGPEACEPSHPCGSR